MGLCWYEVALYIQALLPYQNMLNFRSFFMGQHLIWMRFTNINTVMHHNDSQFIINICIAFVDWVALLWYVFVNSHSLQHNSRGHICPDRVLTLKWFQFSAFFLLFSFLWNTGISKSAGVTHNSIITFQRLVCLS